jgi:drug/metabolite transporter (DMT)-like permease
LPLLPAAAFVLVWSSGYISGPAAVRAAAPLTVLGWRFVLAAALGALVALALRRSPRMSRPVLLRVAVIGLAMNAVQFSMMFLAFDRGLPAVLGSLFHALSPVLTALLAAVLLRERISRIQVGGFVLGPEVEEAGGYVAVALGATAMLMLSIGTLGQRWIGEEPDLLWSTVVQFAVSAPPVLLAGLVFEGPWPVVDPTVTAVALGFQVVVNSLLGLGLLALLVRRAGSGAAAALFFLSPPVTAVLAWLVLGETLGLREVVGLVVAVVGVAAATWTRKDPPP